MTLERCNGPRTASTKCGSPDRATKRSALAGLHRRVALIRVKSMSALRRRLESRKEIRAIVEVAEWGVPTAGAEATTNHVRRAGDTRFAQLRKELGNADA